VTVDLDLDDSRRTALGRDDGEALPRVPKAQGPGSFPATELPPVIATGVSEFLSASRRGG
jgi:hypothetical protein